MKLGERLAAAVSQAQSLSALIQASHQFYGTAQVIATKAQAQLPQQPACCAGCYYCCHIPVGVTAPEVFVAAAHIGTQFTPEQQQALLQRLQQHVAAKRPVPIAEQFTLRLRCPLLVEGRCSVHVARPLTCRRFHSLDVSPCLDFYEHPSKPTPPPPQAPELISTWDRIIHLSDQAHGHSGYDTAGYELGAALLEALTDPEVPARYLRKEQTFLRAQQFWPRRGASVSPQEQG